MIRNADGTTSDIWRPRLDESVETATSPEGDRLPPEPELGDPLNLGEGTWTCVGAE